MDQEQKNIELSNTVSNLKGKIEEQSKKNLIKENKLIDEINKHKETIELKEKWANQYTESFKEKDMLISK